MTPVPSWVLSAAVEDERLWDTCIFCAQEIHFSNLGPTDQWRWLGAGDAYPDICPENDPLLIGPRATPFHVPANSPVR